MEMVRGTSFFIPWNVWSIWDNYWIQKN